MAAVNRSALLPFSAEQMYQLVNDVEAYPQFLPWCSSSKIVEQSDSHMLASIHMRKGRVNHSFTTRNDLIDGHKIIVNLVDGPFKKLEGNWVFDNLSDQGSRIRLELDFEFSNKLVEMLVGPVFHHIANTLVDSFVKRAREVYRT